MIILDENLILDDKDTLTHLRYPLAWIGTIRLLRLT